MFDRKNKLPTIRFLNKDIKKKANSTLHDSLAEKELEHQ